VNCANCKSELTGDYCSNCGQPAKSRRGPIWKVVGEFAEEVFAPNSKFFASILTLLFKPGALSKKFIDGKRVSILPPVRMYLVVSLIFFIVFQIPEIDVGKHNVYIGDTLIGREEPLEGKGVGTFNFMSTPDSDDPVSVWINEQLADKKEKLVKENPQVTIDRIFNKLEDLLPNALILFLPLFALIMKILYLFKRVLYFDHLIFALHFQTWLMGVVLIIYGLSLQSAYWAWLTALIPVYLAIAQKKVYEQTYWLVIPKTFLIVIIYTIMAAICGAFAMVGAIALL